MKKKIIFVLFIALFFVTKVNAKCEYGIPSPAIPLNGAWIGYPELHYKFTTSASSCLAKNMRVYFTMGSVSPPSSKWYIEAMLMEYDVDPNEDDPVKLYTGQLHAEGYVEWDENVETLDNGNLDSAGDQTCELYMKFRLDPPINPNGYLAADTFGYTICVD